MTNETSGISRRTLAKGAAWAVPAVAVAAATPAMAQSGADCLTFSLAADACKWPGANENWAYDIKLDVCNTCDTPITITITGVLSNSQCSPQLSSCEGFDYETVNVPANKCAGADLGAWTGCSSGAFINVYGYAGTYDASKTPELLGQYKANTKVEACAVGNVNPCAPGATSTTTTVAEATTTTTSTTEAGGTTTTSTTEAVGTTTTSTTV